MVVYYRYRSGQAVGVQSKCIVINQLQGRIYDASRLISIKMVRDGTSAERCVLKYIYSYSHRASTCYIILMHVHVHIRERRTEIDYNR